MNWFDYTLVAWWLFSTLVVIGAVGKPRKPVEPSTAVGVSIVNGLLVAGLLFSRGVLS